MTDLPEFLFARIAEDEADARALAHGARMWGKTTARRRLVECESKREAVEELKLLALVGVGYPDEAGPESAQRVLKLLAQPYADHPDYLDVWRP